MSEGLAFDRVENRSDDPGCIRRLLSRSLFFWLRDRLRSTRDRTLYHQQTLGTSLVAWSYPHRVVSYLDSIVAWGCGVGQQGWEKKSRIVVDSNLLSTVLLFLA
jgi:hypothetical protein